MIPFSRRPDLRQARAKTRRRPGLESLEGRQLLSLGAEFQVNTTARNAQFDSDVARSANGQSVVVWTDTFSGSDHDIRAQRYNRSGLKQGPEIVVAGSGLDDVTPAVAMDPRGDFVVTWTQSQGSDTNVLAQRFDSNGNRFGAITPVGVGTFREHNPDVAMDARGDFIVAYTRDTNNNNPDVFAKRFRFDTGAGTGVFSVATTPRAEDRASVAMAPDGRFDVAYQLAFSGTDDDIKVGRFAASGASLGTLTVAGSTQREQAPSLSMDDLGNAVVAYQKLVGGDFDIKARRVSAGGSLGAEINIAATSADELNPSVALKRGGGGFVVAFEGAGRVKVAEVSAVDAVLATLDAGAARSAPAVAIDGSSNYMLTDTSLETIFFPSFHIDRNIKARLGHLP